MGSLLDFNERLSYGSAREDITNTRPNVPFVRLKAEIPQLDAQNTH